MSNTDTIKKMYAAFQKGDVATILAQCDEKVEWNHQDLATRDIPWNGNFSGTKNLPGFFKAVGENLDLSKFEPMHFVEQGKFVAVYLRIEGKVRKNGKGVAHDAVHFWTFNDKGKVTRYRQFNDTAMQREVWK